jgi:hypothetical protein
MSFNFNANSYSVKVKSGEVQINQYDKNRDSDPHKKARLRDMLSQVENCLNQIKKLGLPEIQKLTNFAEALRNDIQKDPGLSDLKDQISRLHDQLKAVQKAQAATTT